MQYTSNEAELNFRYNDNYDTDDWEEHLRRRRGSDGSLSTQGGSVASSADRSPPPIHRNVRRHHGGTSRDRSLHRPALYRGERHRYEASRNGDRDRSGLYRSEGYRAESSRASTSPLGFSVASSSSKSSDGRSDTSDFSLPFQAPSLIGSYTGGSDRSDSSGGRSTSSRLTTHSTPRNRSPIGNRSTLSPPPRNRTPTSGRSDTSSNLSWSVPFGSEASGGSSDIYPGSTSTSSGHYHSDRQHRQPHRDSTHDRLDRLYSGSRRESSRRYH